MAHLHYRYLISVFLGSLLFAKSCCGKYIDDNSNTNHSNTYWATCAVPGTVLMIFHSFYSSIFTTMEADLTTTSILEESKVQY